MPVAKKTIAKNREIEVGTQYRTLSFEREHIDAESRLVELSFSSETAVRRYFGYEILSHRTGEFDFSRLHDNAAFLMDHMLRDQRGVVEKVWLEDGKGRAVVRLSKNERGEELLQDMLDNIRTKISVGYDLIEVLDAWEQDGEEYYRFKWAPYEISSVSVEADPSVGLGRNKDNNVKKLQVRSKMTEEEKKRLAEEKAQREKEAAEKKRVADEKLLRDKTPVSMSVSEQINAERQRGTDIRQLGAQFGMSEEAKQAVSQNIRVADFQAKVLETVRSRSSKPTGTDIVLGLTDKEKQRYSLVSAVRANITGNWKKAGFEREISDSLSQASGKDSRGFMVNGEVLSSLGRGQSVGESGKGAELVSTDLHSDKFIELLRDRSLAAQLGVRMMTGLVGNVDIPKMLSGSSFYWIDEGEDGTESDASFGIVSMKPNTVAGAVPITRRLMAQSTPDVDVLLRDDLLSGIGLALDKALFMGTGINNQPLGIINQTGINAVDLTTLGLTHAGLVAFETAIEEAHALMGGINYLANAGTKGTLKTTLKNNNDSHYLWENNELNGYPAEVLHGLLSKAVLAGDFSQAMIGTWGAIDLMIDNSTKAASGGTVLRVFQDADVAVRQPKAFSYGIDNS